MSIKPEIIDAMVASGCTAEQIAAVVKADMRADEEAKAERRERDRVRKRNQRDAEKVAKSITASEMSRGQTRIPRDTPETKVSPTPPSKTQTPSPHSPPSGAHTPHHSAKSTKGTRLDPGWKPTGEDLASAMAEGLSEFEARREAAKFRDYWIARPGKEGVKLDWPATWRNWVRRSAENLGRSPPAQACSSTEEERRKREDYFRRTGNWNPKWGDPPPRKATADSMH